MQVATDRHAAGAPRAEPRGADRARVVGRVRRTDRARSAGAPRRSGVRGGDRPGGRSHAAGGDLRAAVAPDDGRVAVDLVVVPAVVDQLARMADGYERSDGELVGADQPPATHAAAPARRPARARRRPRRAPRRHAVRGAAAAEPRLGRPRGRPRPPTGARDRRSSPSVSIASPRPSRPGRRRARSTSPACSGSPIGAPRRCSCRPTRSSGRPAERLRAAAHRDRDDDGRRRARPRAPRPRRAGPAGRSPAARRPGARGTGRAGRARDDLAGAAGARPAARRHRDGARGRGRDAPGPAPDVWAPLVRRLSEAPFLGPTTRRTFAERVNPVQETR